MEYQFGGNKMYWKNIIVLYGIIILGLSLGVSKVVAVSNTVNVDCFFRL